MENKLSRQKVVSKLYDNNNVEFTWSIEMCRVTVCSFADR